MRPLEIGILYGTVILASRLISQFRDLLPPAAHPSLLVALLLLYVPLVHNRIRRTGLVFFDSSPQAFIRSVRYFAIVSLAIFPLFLAGNHFYQTILFNPHFQPRPIPDFYSLIAFQLLAVALPEEFFFRGWLQSHVVKRFGTWRGIVVTSLLFALSHSLIQLAWWHFAIFFPGLVFGWLKEKTGGITASVLFHAMSNLLAAWIGVSYR